MEELNKKIQDLGYLPLNNNYERGIYKYQEALEKEPEKYIIPECLPACLELWKKNIYTFMTSDYSDKDNIWIEVNANALSEDNKAIFLALENKGVKLSSKTRNIVRFTVDGVGLKAQEELLSYAKEFKMQDVSPLYAYTTKEEFLINYCSCYQEIDNPNYEVKIPPLDLTISNERWLNQMDEYSDWLSSTSSKRKIKVLDKTKMTKSLEEYVKDHNMVLADNRVYFSPFHYEKHKNYERELIRQDNYAKKKSMVK